MPFLAPIFAAVSAFAGTWVGQLVIGIGASIAQGLLQKILNGNKQQETQTQKPSGFKLSVQMGDTNPLSFQVGYAGTSGSRKYIGTWGKSGEVPNAYLTEVRQLGDLPVPGLSGFWAMKQRCTIDWGATPTSQGYPVLEFRLNGVDNMWVKFRTGAEVSADPFLVSTFGTHPVYPWTNEFIGRGAPHAIITTLFNRELFPREPEFMFEPAPRVFYDLRKDSTNGGSGLHRWNDQSTWEPTLNPVVIVYNIIRGIYYNGEWIYGGRNLPAFRLPPSSWIAAANECDLPIALAAGGTEPQFRCGSEIDVNVEPIATIKDIGLSCNMRLSEIGGIFEVMVGTPGAAVFAFTDADIIVSRGQTYSSFPGLNDTHNAIEATYPEPGEMWAQKDAPARYNADWEAEDDGRRLATGVVFGSVPFGFQVQRLMASLIADDRRWRTHFITFPPEAWYLTGTCVVSWTSARNGYVNKKFLVIKIEGEPGMMQPVILREIDASDYSWTSDQELPNPIGNLVIVRPSPQTPTGFQAFPAIFYDSDNVARRPSIGIIYDGNMPDIRAVHVLVRLKSSGAYVYEQELPFAVPYANTLNGVFLPNTLYEVAIAYVAYTGRPMEFTLYQDVFTDNVQLVPGKDFDPYDGVVGFPQLDTDVKNLFDYIGMSNLELLKAIQNVGTGASDQEYANSLQFQEIRQEVGVQFEDVTATFSQTITVAIVPINNQLQAFSDYFTELVAGNGDDISTARFRMTTLSGPTGYSRIGAQTRVDVADPNAWRGAAWYLDTPTNPALPTRFLVDAEQFVVVSPNGPENPLVFDGVALRLNVANIGEVRTGLVRDIADTFRFDLANMIIYRTDGTFTIDAKNKRIKITS